QPEPPASLPGFGPPASFIALSAADGGPSLKLPLSRLPCGLAPSPFELSFPVESQPTVTRVAILMRKTVPSRILTGESNLHAIKWSVISLRNPGQVFTAGTNPVPSWSIFCSVFWLVLLGRGGRGVTYVKKLCSQFSPSGEFLDVSDTPSP